MLTENKLEDLLEQLVCRFKIYFAQGLEGAFLYGSYARGDYNSDSDVNIMIIADIPPEELLYSPHSIKKITDQIARRFDTIISLVAVSCEEYKTNRDYTPLFEIVQSEGVRLV